VHTGTGLNQRAGDGLTDTARASGYDGPATGKIELHKPKPLVKYLKSVL